MMGMRHGGLPTIFHRSELPPISPTNYLARIATYGGSSPACLVLGLFFIDRIAYMDDRFFLTSHNVHRLLVTAILIASKYLEDRQISLRHFANVGGIAAPELIHQENDMLRRLSYRLGISVDEFNIYLRCLAEEVQRYSC